MRSAAVRSRRSRLPAKRIGRRLAVTSRAGFVADLANATVAQLLIPTHDLDRAVVFYRDTLGLPLLFTAPPQMAFFQCGGVSLLVGVPTDARIDHPIAGVYFQVPYIEAAHRTLSQRGVAFDAAPHVVHRTAEATLWLAEFRDPDGNALALMAQNADRSPPTT